MYLGGWPPLGNRGPVPVGPPGSLPPNGLMAPAAAVVAQREAAAAALSAGVANAFAAAKSVAAPASFRAFGPTIYHDVLQSRQYYQSAGARTPGLAELAVQPVDAVTANANAPRVHNLNAEQWTTAANKSTCCPAPMHYPGVPWGDAIADVGPCGDPLTAPGSAGSSGTLSWVMQHPWAALLLAAATGFALRELAEKK